MPAVTEMAPGRSSLVPEPCDSLSTRGARKSTIAPIGALMNSAQRQLA